ncbi:GTP cyclohydrolase 1 [Candidatus Fokinia solitaria]|uniref:GTP cyclohydrolase 1 n=1 Tax=Candidatus Fokinia solitaria TaxID=1802984 RepID=A0A2U8BSE7_9RICK|nr:GTP cyclohydrolase I FolE [Candidatus Fokinia solitaria]AWD33269.1 GTP cyclohydrolase 1 [Candidatus Fokinia solitaria]
MSKVKEHEIENSIRKILEYIGENPDREGLSETPKRVVKAFKEYFSGYNQNHHEILGKTFTETAGYSDMIALTNLRVQSHCEHHIAPITGQAIVAYIPKNAVVGISKISRLVSMYSHRLQLQERLTKQILDAIDEVLTPYGTAVYISASHSCLSKRGICDDEAMVQTFAFSGDFLNSQLDYKQRFIALTQRV